jgi:nitrogen fixation protein NifQ
MVQADPYRWLMAGNDHGDPFDRHVLACACAIALADPSRPLAAGLGLSAESLAALVGFYFPHAPGLLAGLEPDEDGSRIAALHEPALRNLLLDHATEDRLETEWLAAIIARRSLDSHFLWQDMGLSARSELTRLMRRHFTTLAAENTKDMRWKRFFIRELCRRHGQAMCHTDDCTACPDLAACFGGEDGPPLRPRPEKRHLPALPA